MPVCFPQQAHFTQSMIHNLPQLSLDFPQGKHKFLPVTIKTSRKSTNRLTAIIQEDKGAVATSQLSFFENVCAYFDKAAAFTQHPKGLLDQIKECNSVYALQFPI